MLQTINLLADFMGLFTYPNEEQEVTKLEEDPFLSEFSDDDWLKILKIVEPRHFSQRECLVNQGELDNAFYILTEGEVDIITTKDGHHIETLATIPAGSVFGEISFFDGLPRSATIKAKSDGTVLKFSHHTFETLAAWEPVISRKILFELGRIIAARLRWTTSLKT